MSSKIFLGFASAALLSACDSDGASEFTRLSEARSATLGSCTDLRQLPIFGAHSNSRRS